MQHSAQSKAMNPMQDAMQHFAGRGAQMGSLSVSVRSGNSASPAIDMNALTATARVLHQTLEELDGACG